MTITESLEILQTFFQFGLSMVLTLWFIDRKRGNRY